MDVGSSRFDYASGIRTVALRFAARNLPIHNVDIAEPDSVTILELMNFPEDTELVTDDTLERLRVFKGLKTLVIGCPQVSDRGLKTIAELKGLEALIIYDGRITDGGIQTLTALPKMRTLGIFETQVTLKGIDRLKAELKNASIELWGMGEHGEIFRPVRLD